MAVKQLASKVDPLLFSDDLQSNVPYSDARLEDYSVGGGDLAFNDGIVLALLKVDLLRPTQGRFYPADPPR